MSYIDSGKSEGATLHLGGQRHGDEGYWIQPTIFTNTKPNMKIVQEEIFGPVGVVIKFDDEEDVVHQANDSMYGLAAAIFTQDITRGLQMAHRLKAGTAWVRSAGLLPVFLRLADGGVTRSTVRTSFTRRFRSVGSNSRVSDASSASMRFSSTSFSQCHTAPFRC